MLLSHPVLRVRTSTLCVVKLLFVLLVLLTLLGACSEETNQFGGQRDAAAAVDPSAPDPHGDDTASDADGEWGTRVARCPIGIDSSTADVISAMADRLEDTGELGRTMDDLGDLMATGDAPPEALVELALVIPEAHEVMVEHNDPCADRLGAAIGRLGSDAPAGSVEQVTDDSQAVAAAYGLSGSEAACVSERLTPDADDTAVLLAHSQCLNGN